jgi:hypothetical protein
MPFHSNKFAPAESDFGVTNMGAALLETGRTLSPFANSRGNLIVLADSR